MHLPSLRQISSIRIRPDLAFSASRFGAVLVSTITSTSSKNDVVLLFDSLLQEETEKMVSAIAVEKNNLFIMDWF